MAGQSAPIHGPAPRRRNSIRTRRPRSPSSGRPSRLIRASIRTYHDDQPRESPDRRWRRRRCASATAGMATVSADGHCVRKRSYARRAPWMFPARSYAGRSRTARTVPRVALPTRSRGRAFQPPVAVGGAIRRSGDSSTNASDSIACASSQRSRRPRHARARRRAVFARRAPRRSAPRAPTETRARSRATTETGPGHATPIHVARPRQCLAEPIEQRGSTRPNHHAVRRV